VKSGLRRVDGAIVWLGAIALVASAYTWMAFGMEWETAAGRIGPGFFPRIIGGLTVVLCIAAIVRRLRERAPAEAEPGPRHGRLVAIVALALLGYLFLFEYAGAALASVAFMLVVLPVLNPGRTVANVALAVLLPAALYVLFELALNAGLPPGPLPAI
jgi:putative tricarboxylic transport membrane protein